VKKKVLVLITILATLLVFSFGTASAQWQDAILFPYWVSGGGYATFIQVINLATVDTPISGTNQGKLHYVYVYNSDTETCQHYDDVGKTTQNDILLYEVTKAFYQGTSNEQLLPGDTTSTSPTLSSSAKWGYLVVRHHPDNFDIDHEGEIQGQEYVVNLSTGTIWAINAINNPGSDPEEEYEFDWTEGHENYISWLPEIYASTMWYFFPLEFNLISEINWNFSVLVGDYYEGVFDNNESLKSGLKPLMVGCWDTTMESDGTPVNPGSGPVTANFFYTLQEIMTGEQYAAVANTGGWTQVSYDDLAMSPNPEAPPSGLTYKLQSTQILGNAMNTILFEPGEPRDSYTK
jgi:hypothetical protein